MPTNPIFKEEKKSRRVFKKFDPATDYMVDYVEGLGLDTVFTRQRRYEESIAGVVPSTGRCDFGSLGICCRQCLMGPCRIWHKDVTLALRVNAPNQTKGTCGASADTIVARNWLSFHSRGSAAHAAAAKETVETFLKAATGKATFEIRDKDKLNAIAARLGVSSKLPVKKKAQEIAKIALADLIGVPDGKENKEGMKFANKYLPSKVIKSLKENDIMPRNAFEEIIDSDHQTVIGMMSDPYYFIMQTMKVGVSDLMSLLITTELHDAMLGTPTPVATKIGLSVLKEDEVNIAVHGHIPTLTEKLIEHAGSKKMLSKLKVTGAKGINIVGLCCTGAEVLQRHSIPLAGNNLQEDLLIATGLVDAFLMDVQCSYPSAHDMAEKFHTKVITTMKDARVPMADHQKFEAEKADEWAVKALETAINNFPKRADKTHLPPFEPVDILAGFSVEACVKVLSQINKKNPLKPLIDNIVDGNIYGVCLMAGCISPKLHSESTYYELSKELLKHNILVVGTGCAAGACGRSGLMTPDAAKEFAGEKLLAVLSALGDAAGLGAPLPPVWHMGSCVDNSRPLTLASALAETLKVEYKDLPIVISAFEAVTEKSVVIGSGAVAVGFPVHIGVVPPVLGSPLVSKMLTQDMKEITGGYFIVEPDPKKAADDLIAAVKEKRKALGLPL